MPLYEYECGSCGHRFETIRKFSDPPIDTCPRCGQSVRKLQASPAIQFKGSGWYVTDYARKESSAKAKSEAEQKAGESSGADSAAQGEKGEKEEKREKGEKVEKKPAAADSPASTGAPAASSDKKSS